MPWQLGVMLNYKLRFWNFRQGLDGPTTELLAASFFDDEALTSTSTSTPLKALQEAIKLATPSPLKFYDLKSDAVTPRNGSSFQTTPGITSVLSGDNFISFQGCTSLYVSDISEIGLGYCRIFFLSALATTVFLPLHISYKRAGGYVVHCYMIYCYHCTNFVILMSVAL